MINFLVNRHRQYCCKLGGIVTNKFEKINQLIEALGLQKNFKALVKQGMDSIAPQAKNMYEMTAVEFDFFQRKCLEKINNKQEEVISEIANLYNRHFTEKDIEAQVIFFTSPAGKKLIESQLSINQEFIEIATKVSKQAVQEIIQELERITT